MKHEGHKPGPWLCECGKYPSGKCPDYLLAENERLRELLSHLTHEYRQILKPVEDSPGFIWMMLHKQFLEDVKAALAGGKGEK